MHDKRNYYAEIRKIKGVKMSLSSEVNGAKSPEQIPSVFAKEYESLLNDTGVDIEFLDSIKHIIKTKIHTNEHSFEEALLNETDICTAIKCLKSKKTDGLFDIVSDNILHGHPKLHDHMVKCSLHA
jgi:hypothetical protein